MTVFKLFFSNIFTYLKPWLELFMKRANTAILAAADKAVLVVAESYIMTGNEDLDDRQRRELAFKAIGDELKLQGLTIGVDVARSLIWDAIQVAVVKARAATEQK